MEELHPLTQLRKLTINKLERVDIGTSVLTSKQYLRELYMSFSSASKIGSQYGEMEIKKIEKVMEELFPPPSLKRLVIIRYPGCRYPSWMSKYTSIACFSRLEAVELWDCMSCTQLPSLGKLPQLKWLGIYGADSIVTVGPELLFGDHPQTGDRAFPTLEFLRFKNMENWEEWVLGDDESINNGKLLPRLKQLEIIDCPKLRSLPAGLQHATKLEQLFVVNAHCIQEVKNLPFLSKLLQVINCPCLQEIHHLPLLRKLIIRDCPHLTHIAELNSVEGLVLFSEAERLPDWLSELSLELEPHQMTDFQFDLNCSSQILFQRCWKGGEDWPIIKRFPQVNIYRRGTGKFFSYTNASGQSSG